MSIERLGPTDPLAAYGRTQKTNRAQSNSGADSIAVSDEARVKAELFRLNEHVRNADDVRMDRVEEVKRKLLDPSYIDDKVLGSVADKLMEQFGLE